MLVLGQRRVRFLGKERSWTQIIGRIAALMSVIMYLSYIPQIAENLAGNPAEPWQPLAAFVNCSIWVLYGLLIQDKPVWMASVPGVVLGFAAGVTAIIHF